jgi:hypothetical protein
MISVEIQEEGHVAEAGMIKEVMEVTTCAERLDVRIGTDALGNDGCVEVDGDLVRKGDPYRIESQRTQEVDIILGVVNP